MSINKISIDNTLPCVFAGMEREEPVKSSAVWLQRLTIERPQRVMIEAESGTGKSSLCNFIYGLRKDYTGSIAFDGTDIRTFDIDRWCELRRTSLAYLPQEMRLFPELTVWENIDIKNRLTHHRSERWITDALEMLEVSVKRDVQASKLSVGQQQRVAIVRALCQPFDFLLIDEPVSHLDSRTNALAASLIEATAREENAGVIATSVGNKISLTFEMELKL